MSYEKITLKLEEGRFRDFIICDYAANQVDVRFAVVVIDHNPCGIGLGNCKPEIHDFEDYNKAKAWVESNR